MKLTNPEKLILVMLTEVYQHLKIKGELDPKFIQSAIFSDNAWGLHWKYSGLFSGANETPPEVSEVVDILDMWDRIEESYSALSPAEKKRVETEAKPFGKDPRFIGFDGNNETDLLGIARFLIDDLERFSRFKGRDLNSHMPMSRESYARMVKVYKPLRAPSMLGADNLIKILCEKTHPDFRNETN